MQSFSWIFPSPLSLLLKNTLKKFLSGKNKYKEDSEKEGIKQT